MSSLLQPQRPLLEFPRQDPTSPDTYRIMRALHELLSFCLISWDGDDSFEPPSCGAVRHFSGYKYLATLLLLELPQLGLPLVLVSKGEHKPLFRFHAESDQDYSFYDLPILPSQNLVASETNQKHTYLVCSSLVTFLSSGNGQVLLLGAYFVTLVLHMKFAAIPAVWLATKMTGSTEVRIMRWARSSNVDSVSTFD